MGDLISRAAAIAQIKENYCDWCDHTDLCKSCETHDCIATIEQQVPAVDVAPVVHGNWIECYERSRHYYCSNCGKVQGIASVVMKYCPECGAKMAQHPWAGRYADQSGAEYADNPTV